MTVLQILIALFVLSIVGSIVGTCLCLWVANQATKWKGKE